ncbi:MAG: alpha/beta hydrolase [Pseudomonadales bacterium]
MKKILLNATYVALFAYILAAILLYSFQRDLLYFPSAKYDHEFERFSISSNDETLEIIVLNRDQPKALIYFGGNGEAVVAKAKEFSSELSGVTTYLVNYRGYGGSSGKPTESGIYADALAVYDHLKGSHTQFSVAGRSLGSGVATYLAANRPIESLALITPYDSVLDVAKHKFKMFPIKLLLKDRYDSLSRVERIKSKVLVIAAEHDRVIPMRNTQRLVDAFESDKVVLKVIDDVGHSSLSISPEYYQALRDFMGIRSS